MTAIYIGGSFLSFLGIILLIISFRKDFNKLNIVQKLGIVITTIGVVVPFFVGFFTN